MVSRNLLIALLSLGCVFAASCRIKETNKVPPGPVEISYTSVRGGSPRVVDYFVIISDTDPSVAKSDSNHSGTDCFVVPALVELIFKRKLLEILNKYGWSDLASLPPRSADEPFRRLAIKMGGSLSYLELHEYSPADEFINDANFKRFYSVVSEVRVLGETFGVRFRIENLSAADDLGVPWTGRSNGSNPKPCDR